MIKGKLRLKLEVVHGSLKPVKQFVLDRQNGEKLGLELANVNDNSEAGVGCQVVKVHPGGLGQEVLLCSTFLRRRTMAETVLLIRPELNKGTSFKRSMERTCSKNLTMVC